VLFQITEKVSILINKDVFYKDDAEDTQDECNEDPVANKKRAENEWKKLI